MRVADYRQTYHYDSLSRPIKIDTRMALDNFSQTQHYDSLGRVYKIDYPGNTLSIIRHYNEYGYLHQVSDAANDTVYWQGNETNADGAFTRSTLGNGRIVQKAYDSHSGRLHHISTDNGIQNLHYQFDAIGNILQRQDINRNSIETFTYDPLNRLTHSSLSINGQQTQQQRIAYDALGNITEKDGNRYHYDSSRPHAVTRIGNKTLHYDDNGNLSHDSSGRDITWTYDNKPERIRQGSTQRRFDYGPDRARYRQQHILASGVQSTTLYVGSLFEQIKQGNSIKNRHYIKVGGQTIATLIRYSGGATDTRYLHRDHLGSVSHITDEHGNLIENNDYDAFGKRRPISGNVNEPLPLSIEPRGYTDHEHLDDLGIIHMTKPSGTVLNSDKLAPQGRGQDSPNSGRIYDPQLGRFLSADSIIQFPGNQQSLNRYSYVLNNPLSYTDPSGHKVNIVQAIFSVALTYASGGIAGSILGIENFAASAIIANTTNFAVFAGTSMVLNGAASAAMGGTFAEGMISGGINALTAGAFSYIGTSSIFNGADIGLGAGITVKRIIAHGFVGGVSSELQGGKFGQGFIASAFAKSAANITGSNKALGIAITTIVGGTASELAGGSFANGAVTSALGYVYNYLEGDFDDPENVCSAPPACDNDTAVIYIIGGALLVIDLADGLQPDVFMWWMGVRQAAKGGR